MRPHTLKRCDGVIACRFGSLSVTLHLSKRYLYHLIYSCDPVYFGIIMSIYKMKLSEISCQHWPQFKRDEMVK